MHTAPSLRRLIGVFITVGLASAIAAEAADNQVPSCSSNGGNFIPTVRAGQATTTGAACFDDDGDTVTLQVVTQPVHGTAGVADNRIVYTSAAAYTGPDSFTYRGTDGHGGTAEPATWNVDVENPTPPDCHLDGAITVRPGKARDVSVLCFNRFSDPISDVDVVTPPTKGSLSVPQFIPEDGSGFFVFTYTAGAGTTGTDAFTFTATSVAGTGQPVTQDITISESANTAPTCDSPFPFGVPVGGTVGVNANCRDAEDDPLTYGPATGAQHGTVTGPDANGTFTYTAGGAYTGPDAFSTTVQDDHGGSTTATVQMDVGGETTPTPTPTPMTTATATTTPAATITATPAPTATAGISAQPPIEPKVVRRIIAAARTATRGRAPALTVAVEPFAQDVSLDLRLRFRARPAGKASLTLARGQSGRLKAKLVGRAKSRLKKRGRLEVTGRLTVTTTATGARTTASKAVSVTYRRR